MIFLNVGGVYFVTSRTTLTAGDHFFRALVADNEETAEYFVDRDPTYFRHVLNWMRGVRLLPEDNVALQELQWEADYYVMHDLRDAIIKCKARYSLGRSLHTIASKLR
jgi:hypothetical protein